MNLKQSFSRKRHRKTKFASTKTTLFSVKALEWYFACIVAFRVQSLWALMPPISLITMKQWML